MSGLASTPMAAGDRVFELMDTPSEESGEELIIRRHRIEFKDVSFEHTPGVLVLKHFEFHGRAWADGGLCRSYRFRKISLMNLLFRFCLGPNEWSDLD